MAKKRSKKRRGLCPSLKQIEGGLYLDFEGFAPGQYGGKPPALCGYRLGGKGPVTQVVFSKGLKWAALDSNLEFHECRTSFLAELFESQKPGKLFAFTEHEKKAIKTELGWNIDRSYGNVHTISKYNLGPELPSGCENRLIDFLQIVGINVPEDYGKSQVTSWMRSIMEYSRTKSSWATAPLEVRKKWKKLLSHNEFDVTSMYDLLKRIHGEFRLRK